MNLEDIIQAVEALKKRYQKLIADYAAKEGIDEAGANKASKGIPAEFLVTFHSEVEAQLKICEIFKKISSQDASRPEFGLAAFELGIMELALGKNVDNLDSDPNQATKLQNLAQLLFSCLDQSQEQQDNPITFLAKMRVFPRSTAVVKVETNTSVLSKQTVELILKRLLDICKSALVDVQNKGQVQTLNALRHKAILANEALQKLYATTPGKTLEKKQVDADIAALRKQIEPEPSKSVKLKPSNS